MIIVAKHVVKLLRNATLSTNMNNTIVKNVITEKGPQVADLKCGKMLHETTVYKRAKNGCLTLRGHLLNDFLKNYYYPV